MTEKDEKVLLDEDERKKYEFRDEDVAIFRTERGLDENIVRQISAIKKEPEFMLDFRLKALKEFFSHHQPNFGPSLDFIDFQDYTYYTKVSKGIADKWEEVPETVKNTFDRLREHPEIFRKYFGKLVPPTDNKYAALNSAVWSGGSFIYVPKGVRLEKPLQSYFRINNKRSGQFERTLIICDDDSELNYVEGCTAPMYSKESLHAAIVEIFVGKRAKMRYTTIQNWSSSILNLVTQRALVDEDGLMEWVDGNIGSKLCMKYPCCILRGDRSRGSTISVAVASHGQFQDTGAKMIHIGKDTSSTIISKSISRNGGTSNFRGQIHIAKSALHAKAHEECDTLILDDHSFSDTIPNNSVDNADSYLEHEASVSKINEDQLFYLMSRGLSKEDATQMIVMGFLEPFSKELPMEYAVELNQLIKFDMSGSIG